MGILAQVLMYIQPEILLMVVHSNGDVDFIYLGDRTPMGGR